MVSIGNYDGLVENMYYYLWYKDDSMKQEQFSICVPNTIIFKQGIISVWYFTNENNEILIKKEDNRNIENIIRKLSRGKQESEIAAYYMYSHKYNYNADEYESDFTTVSEKKKQIKILQNNKICIVYLTKKELPQFLKNKSKPPEGVLQEYVKPIGDHETVVQAVWSPSVCILSKRQNFRNYWDKQYDAYERTTTFDGAEVYSRTVPIRGKEISQELRKQVKQIVQKITNISYEKITISRIVLYFKPDSNNKLWYLYCSSLRTNDEIKNSNINKHLHQNNTPVALATNYEQPYSIKLSATTNTMHPVKLLKDINCFNCNQLCQSDDLFHVPYSYIIKTFEQNVDQQQLKNQYISIQQSDPLKQPPLMTRNYKSCEIKDFQCYNQQEYLRDIHSHIPPLILKIYPHITVELYDKLKQNDSFLIKTLLLCNDCFLNCSKINSQLTGSKIIIRSKIIPKYLTSKTKLMQSSQIKNTFQQMNLQLNQSKKLISVRASSAKNIRNRSFMSARNSIQKQSSRQINIKLSDLSDSDIKIGTMSTRNKTLLNLEQDTCRNKS